MKLNSKLTGGLAWAGLIVVLAVPSADLLTGKERSDAARATSETSVVKTADVGTTALPAAAKPSGQDPVDAYLAKGRKLPSYISDAPAAVASDQPAPVTRLVVPQTPATTAAPQVPKVSVASLPARTEVEPPIPYPASKRPAPPATQVASASPGMIVAPAAGTSPATASEAPLVIDEDLVQRRDAAVARVLEEDPDPRPAGRRIIEEDMLEEWDSGSLAEYLERKGLMSGSEQASASDFGDDDFFLDDDRSEVRVVRRLPRRNDFFFF